MGTLAQARAAAVLLKLAQYHAENANYRAAHGHNLAAAYSRAKYDQYRKVVKGR